MPMARLFFIIGALVLVDIASAQKRVVCIDPGHPSEVGIGTKGARVSEVKLVWQVALALRDRLRKEGYEVVMTKSSEMQKVTNKRRAQIANNSGADLLVRLHCDAASGRGFAVYYPDRQGISRGVRGPSPAVLKATKPVAIRFHKALAAIAGELLKDNGLKPDTKTYIGGKQGALTGSIHSKVPVVLVEMCVLTNRKDESVMLSTKGRSTMLDALVAGVRAAIPIRR